MRPGRTVVAEVFLEFETKSWPNFERYFPEIRDDFQRERERAPEFPGAFSRSWGFGRPPATRGRVLSGSASLRSLRDGASRPLPPPDAGRRRARATPNIHVGHGPCSFRHL